MLPASRELARGTGQSRAHNQKALDKVPLKQVTGDCDGNTD